MRTGKKPSCQKGSRAFVSKLQLKGIDELGDHKSCAAVSTLTEAEAQIQENGADPGKWPTRSYLTRSDDAELKADLINTHIRIFS